MQLVKSMLILASVGLFGTAAALLLFDVRPVISRWWRRPADETEPAPWIQVRWKLIGRLAAFAVLPLLVAASFTMVPSGMAGVRVSDLWGAQAGTLYPGAHW